MVFLVSLVLVGKHNPGGWALGIADELLWSRLRHRHPAMAIHHLRRGLHRRMPTEPAILATREQAGR